MDLLLKGENIMSDLKKFDVLKLKKNIEKMDEFNIDSIFIEENGDVNKLFYNECKLHELRSCAKLLVAMAVGIAIERKMFDLNTLVYPTIKNIVNVDNVNNLNKIKKWNIKNLLTHTTGYESQMLSEKFIKDIDKNDLVNYALNYEIPYDVGNRFAYNNVEPFILSVFFQEKFQKNIADFINENIFMKLDINEFKWEDYGKYCAGATGLYMKHEDFHKIGQLLLNGGRYNNEQVVPEKWIHEMTKLQIKTPSLYKSDRVFPKIGVGYYVFISRDGYVFRDGSNGQYIIVNKERNILITIMATEKNMKNVTEIFRDIIDG